MMYTNLCQHVINVVREDGSVLTVPPSGVVARVATERKVVNTTPEGVVLHETTFGEVEGLPEPKEGILYIVSGQVAGRADRPDVFSPGELIRGSDGQPIGCRGLTR